MTIIVNRENKLVCCVTNVGLSDYNGCCSTTLNNGFFIVLILSDATLLSSCEIDSSLILISNNCFCGYLTGVKNPCIGYKDSAPILIGFYSSMKVSDQD